MLEIMKVDFIEKLPLDEEHNFRENILWGWTHFWCQEHVTQAGSVWVPNVSFHSGSSFNSISSSKVLKTSHIRDIYFDFWPTKQ